jgi:hypothetical protein
MARWIRIHLPFYVVSLTLGLAVSALFLSNQDSGPGWAMRGLPLDDAWIHLVYARSLAQQGWFFYNPGIPESGMSSPLWVMLLAPLLKVGVAPAVAAKSLSILFGLATSLIVYHFGLDVSRKPAVAWAAGLLVSVEPNFAYARVSGMEVALLAFLLGISLWFAFRQRYLAFGLTIGLAVLARGEATVLGVLVGAVFLGQLYWRRDRLTLATRDEVILAAKVFGPALVLGGAWVVYNYSIGGHLLPNTYYVKHNFALGYVNLPNLFNVWMGYVRQASLTHMWLATITVPLACLGALILIRAHGWSVVPWMIAPVLFLFALSINIAVGPDEWNFTARRYLDHIWPILSVPLAFGAIWVWDLGAILSRRFIVLLMPIGVVALMATLGWTTYARMRVLAAEYSWNCRNIEEVDVAMGKWIAGNIPSLARVGVTDAGAMRYFGEHETLDLIGLNFHAAIGRPLDELLRQYRPEYAVLFRSEYIDRLPYLNPIYSLKPERNTILGGGELVVYQYIGVP